MIYTRYAAGRRLAWERRVLELGCGAGQGFGLVGGAARRLVGGDYSAALVRQGHAHYRARYPFVRLSGDVLPFRDASFDLVLCFEPTYYVPDMDAAFRELGRVTAPGGTVLLAWGPHAGRHSR
jgi:SAM-dependent methyltransferase